MAVDHGAKGNQLMIDADQMLNSHQSGGLCCKKGGRVKVEEACELYTKAANSFKMAKDWNAAGRAFSEAGNLQFDNQRPHEAGNHYVEAAKCYKKVNQAETARCLEKAIDIYTDMGRQKVAAKHHRSLAELYEDEGEMKNLAKSVHHHEMASQLFAGEESTSSSNKCQLQIAKHSVILGNHQKAIDIYEEVGKAALESNLLRYTATDLFFRAGLCHLHQVASTNAESAVTKMTEVIAGYDDANPAFAEARERTLLMGMAEGVASGDVEVFNEAIRTHESVNRLDPWYHEVIKGIRKYTQGAEDMR